MMECSKSFCIFCINATPGGRPARPRAFFMFLKRKPLSGDPGFKSTESRNDPGMSHREAGRRMTPGPRRPFPLRSRGRQGIPGRDNKKAARENTRA